MPQPMILDEAGYFFDPGNDRLREALRAIDGVPNATYLVTHGGVFVFDKLVLKVQERRAAMPDAPLADLARLLIPLATVSAQEAVEAWRVMPEPYELITRSDGDLMIRHQPFNAHLPGLFKTPQSAQEVLAHLLVGAIQPGSGDFEYRGQAMVLCDPLDLALLPPRPLIEADLKPVNYVYAHLRGVTFEPGFEPITETLFEQTKARETSWRTDTARAGGHAQERAADMWARAASLRLDELVDPSDVVPDGWQEEFAALRPCYPELAMLPDGSLYAWFDAYQRECCYINGWTANRDDDFLFYLLGKTADRHFERECARQVGQWVAYALLRGDSLDTALAFGRTCALYDEAMALIAWRIANAMQFLSKDKTSTDLRGRPVFTMGDLYRAGRTCNVGAPLLARQDLSNFMRT